MGLFNPRSVRRGMGARGQRSGPLLADALGVLLPSELQTYLLRASLLTGEAAREAWACWLGRVTDPPAALAEDRHGARRLLPLIFEGLRRNNVEVESRLATYLRTAYVREELRSHTFYGLYAEVVRILARENIPAITLKGPALGGTVYGQPALRHSHDVDLLVAAEDLRRASSALSGIGFRVTGGDSADVQLEHASGLPIEMHSRPFRLTCLRAEPAGLWSRSRSQHIAGEEARVLSPSDALLHVCGVAAYSSRRSPLWASDAWLIVEQEPGLDWDLLVQSAEHAHLGLPLYAMLAYLGGELQARVPGRVLKALWSVADNDPLGLECALFGAQATWTTNYVGLLRRTRGWTGRALILKWALLPSAAYLRCVGSLEDARWLPVYYFFRLGRLATRHALSLRAGRPRSA